MHEQRCCTGLDLEPFYSKLYNPRWPHSPEEHKLKMDLDIKKLRTEILLSQPAPPPQCDSSPRRLPAVGTWLNKPGTPHAESQSTERGGIFPLQASINVILDVCTNPEQTTTIFLQAQTSEQTAKQQLQKHKLLLARNLRGCRLAGNTRDAFD